MKTEISRVILVFMTLPFRRLVSEGDFLSPSDKEGAEVGRSSRNTYEPIPDEGQTSESDEYKTSEERKNSWGVKAAALVVLVWKAESARVWR
ncbi:hypothetical protein CYMTET_11194 [Cymbomonas tetramitiformis]|uniref:Uncharacterized protein n=1 Tax=Cymbomonas tetramitiformis TaxID=36881 RepID=A0AAE0LDQ0_9CHLO|nr:hypothetical protein CYMTET_11194 [Cymbomonas tetramitiformis]